MNDKDLARLVAADLGPDVLAAVDAPPSQDRTRALGIGIPEAVAIAGFLLQCAQTVHQIYSAKKDRELLVAALANSDALLKAYPTLDPEKRLGLIARVLAKFLPESFSEPVRTRSVGGQTEKQRWVGDYVEQRRVSEKVTTRTWSDVKTRDFIGGATLLMPFADQNWWIVYKDIGWKPDASDGPDVVRVDVPGGFVTDLTSVPWYLWSVLNRIGKYGNAAIYHDWLYWKQGELPGVTRDVADRVFDRTMVNMGVDAVTRNTIWGAVRIFGGKPWAENAKAKAAGEKRVLAKFPDDPTITWDDWKKRSGVFK